MLGFLLFHLGQFFTQFVEPFLFVQNSLVFFLDGDFEWFVLCFEDFHLGFLWVERCFELIVFLLQIFDFLLEKSIVGQNLVDLYFWVWIGKGRRLRLSNTITEPVIIFFMFFEKVNIVAILISGSLLNTDSDLWMGHWVLIKIVAIVDLNRESFLMSQVEIGFLLWLIIELFELD